MRPFGITVSTLAAGLALASPATADGISVPAGFNIESAPAPGSVFGQLPDGRLLLATGSFGADQLSVVEPDGSLRLWATGFGSLAGFAVSELSGEMVVGDSLFAPALTLLADLNGDGDVLDAGEATPYPSQPPVLSNEAALLPFSLAFAPGSDVLYMTGSTPFGVSPLLGGVVRFADGGAALFADGMGYAAGLVVTDDALFVADLDAGSFVGRVVRCVDANGDGDALDAGETNDFAAGLSGASGLVRAADGSFYISGQSDSVDFSGCVSRLLPDDSGDGVSDGVDECLFDGFTFAGGLTLLEGPGGFVPGAAGDGTLYVGEFSFAGKRTIRSAPLASTSLVGSVSGNQVVTLHVGGAPGAGGFFALSLDPGCTTVPGVGDLAFGFADITLFSPVATIAADGEALFTLVLRDVPALLGQPVVFQGFSVEDDAIGIGNALSFVFGN